MIRASQLTVLVSVAVLVSGVSAWLRNSVTVKPQDEAVPILQHVAIAFNDVNRIELQRGDEQLLFERTDGIWWQTQPFACRMDTSSMVALVERVQGLLLLGDVSGEVSKEAIGLGQGAHSLSLATTTNKITIHLGRLMLGGRAYASVDDGVPVVVSQSLHRLAVETDHRYWRDIRLFPDMAVDIQRIERRIDNDTLVIDQSSGKWMIREPVSARVHEAALVEWIGRLASLKLGSFVVDEPEDLALFSLLSPRASIAVTNSAGDTRMLLIGGRVSAGSQDRYVKLNDTPMVFRMQWDALSQLFPSTEIIAAPTGSGVSLFDVKRIRIAIKNGETILRRELEAWVDETRGDRVVDQAEVRQLLEWLLESHPTSVAIGPYPRELQVATITFEGYDRMPMDTVRIAVQDDGNWILDNGEHVLRLHPAEAGKVLAHFSTD